MQMSVRTSQLYTALPDSLSIVTSCLYPDHKKLKAHLHPAPAACSNTIMPPFGAHEVPTTDELEKVVTFIHSL